MHLWKRPFRLSLFFLEGKTGKQSCCGHMCESFKQSPPLNCRNICGGRGHACISGGKAPLISHEVATIHEQVAKRIANVRFTTRMYKIHCLKGELWEQHCNRSFSGGLLEKQGRRFRSFLQVTFSSGVSKKLSAKEAVHNLSSANRITF